ncbi:hypothetical protein H2203_005075 [Taxawa tesnikishii (nom. ined.)]|nr:hypothetical protein H2203_005075 [Dothideales sp. JES 119]
MTTPCYPPLSSLQQDLSDTQGLKPAFADRDIPYLARRVPRFGSGPEFSPPLHQDSGFDESMIQALEPSAELRLADAAAPLMHANQPLSVNEQLQDSAAATLHIDAQLKDTSSATPSLLPAPLSYHIPLDPTPEPFTATTAQTPKLPPVLLLQTLQQGQNTLRCHCPGSGKRATTPSPYPMTTTTITT